MTKPPLPTHVFDVTERQWRKFRKWLNQNGSEILAPSTEYEVLRFLGSKTVAVVYRNNAGRLSWVNGADEAWWAYKQQLPWRAAVKRGGKRNTNAARTRHRIATLLERDGDECFLCGEPLNDDITIEHLVAKTHGGPDHLSNLCLAHEGCNSGAKHLSVVEKVRVREARIRKRAMA